MNNEIQLKAEDGKGVRITGVAFSGNEVRQPWSDMPIVIDLNGMEIARQIPLMNQHENDTAMKLGELECRIEDGKLLVDGYITAENELAKDIVSQGRKSDWQMSIGAEVKKRVLCNGEGAIACNGREYAQPCVLIKQCVLREVSVVAIGADSDTNMKIAASLIIPKEEAVSELKLGDASDFSDVSIKAEDDIIESNEDTGNDNTVVLTNNNLTQGEEFMKNSEITADVSVNASAEEKVDVAKVAADAVKAERERVAMIGDICAGEFGDIQAKAISMGWGREETQSAVLSALRSNRPVSAPNVSVKHDTFGQDEMTCALSLRCGIGEAELVKSYGEQAVEAGYKAMDMSLKDVVRECVKAQCGVAPRSIDNESIRAAFSSVTLPGILSNVANKAMLKSFASVPLIAPKLCTEGNLVDFKESDRYRLVDVGNLEEVPANGEIKDGGLSEDGAKNQLATYGKKFCLTRQMIINDDLGAFAKIPQAMGARAARLIDQLFFKRLLANPTQSDGKALFSTDHNNYLTGSTSALTKTALASGIEKFLNQTDSDGQPISIEPKFLLVPSGLKFDAIELVKGVSLIMAGSTDSVRPAYNALSEQGLEVVASPYLSNASYSGYSTTGWYLFGNPAEVDTFEIGYLKGKKTPTVEQGETDFNTLGMWFRVYFDVGVREQDYRGIVASKGKN